MTNTVLVTFAAGRTGWQKAAKRLRREALATGVFSNVFSLNEAWLRNEDPRIYSLCKSYRDKEIYRGFGYWTWKTSILKWAFENFRNDQVLYVDAGHQINLEHDSISNIRKLLVSGENSRGIAWQLPNHREIQWTKVELHLAMNTSSEQMKENQIQANFILMPPGDGRIKFAADFRNMALEKNGFYFNDEIIEPQFPEFIEHRHDQSVFSLLWKKYGYGFYPDKTFAANWGSFPIIAMRNNTGLKATSRPEINWLARHFDATIDKLLKRK
jgi:hypothetical protein